MRRLALAAAVVVAACSDGTTARTITRPATTTTVDEAAWCEAESAALDALIATDAATPGIDPAADAAYIERSDAYIERCFG